MVCFFGAKRASRLSREPFVKVTIVEFLVALFVEFFCIANVEFLVEIIVCFFGANNDSILFSTLVFV